MQTTRNGIALTEEEINIEIRNYERQIKFMRFEIRCLKRELKTKIKVRQQITGEPSHAK